MLNDNEKWNYPTTVLFIVAGLVCSEGKEWMEQRKFTMRQLKDFGFGKQSMECLVQEEVDEIIQGLRWDVTLYDES